MSRLDLWEDRFAALIDAAEKREFHYGNFDCVLFACDVIEALTGQDPAKDHRGKYSGEEEAKNMLLGLVASKAPGATGLYGEGGALEKLADDFARSRGYEEIGRMFAQRGDIALGDVGGMKGLGACVGRQFVFLNPAGGLVRVPLSAPMILTVWRIC